MATRPVPCRSLFLRAARLWVVALRRAGRHAEAREAAFRLRRAWGGMLVQDTVLRA